MPTPIGSRFQAHTPDDVPAPSHPSSGAPPVRSPQPARGSAVEASTDRPPPPAAPSPRLDPRIETLLTTGAGRLDILVTEGEARQALELLRGLSDADFREAIAVLQSKGLCGVLVDHLSWSDQCQFLELASRAGVVEQERGEQPSGVANPPKHPDLYRQSAQLPRALNDLIHEHSKASVAEYKQAYDAYLGRYNDAVARCHSLQEIRALGRPAEPTGTWELTDFRDPRASFYQSDWSLSQSQSSPLGAYVAVAERMESLAGQRHDGSFWFELKLESQISGVALDVDVATGDPSRDVAKLTLGAAVPNLTGDTSVTAKAKLDGTREVSVGTKAGDVGLSATVTTDSSGKLKKAAATVGPVTVTGGEGTGQLGFVPVKFGAGEVKAELGSVAALNREKAELKAGVTAKGKVGPLLEGKLQVTVGMRGLSPAAARRALDGDSVFDRRLPELERGAPWSALPEARRQALEALGWNEAEWRTAQRELGGAR